MFSPPLLATHTTLATPLQRPRYSSSESKATHRGEDGGKLESRDLRGESDVTLEEHKSDNSEYLPAWQGINTPLSQQHFPSALHSPSSLQPSSSSKQIQLEEEPHQLPEDVSSLHLGRLEPASSKGAVAYGRMPEEEEEDHLALTMSGGWEGSRSQLQERRGKSTSGVSHKGSSPLEYKAIRSLR